MPMSSGLRRHGRVQPEAHRTALFGGRRLWGGLDDFGGNGAEVVDVQDALDLAEEAVDEAEVPARDAGDVGNGDAGSRSRGRCPDRPVRCEVPLRYVMRHTSSA